MTDQPRPPTPVAEFREFADLHMPALLTDHLAYAIATAATKALTAQQAEIARLRTELDRYQGRTVYHCRDADMDRIAADWQLPGPSSPDARPGDILRATDTGRELVYTDQCGWVVPEIGCGQ